MLLASSPRASRSGKYRSDAGASDVLFVIAAGCTAVYLVWSTSLLRIRCASSGSVPASIQDFLWRMDAGRALFVLFFMPGDHNNVGLDLPVGVDQSSDSVEIPCRKFLF